MLIDGIWVRGGLNASPLTSNAAIAEMKYATFRFLPTDEDSVAKQKMARRKIENVAKILMSSKAYKESAALS